MRKKLSEIKLRALQCSGCQKLYVPPRYNCSKCGKGEFSEVELEGKGEVYSYTVIRMPFEEFLKEAPYVFAEVKLHEGLVLPGRFVNEEGKKVEIGSKVSFVRWERGVNWFELA
jgi:uncharacterized OB-fold protein